MKKHSIVALSILLCANLVVAQDGASLTEELHKQQKAFSDAKLLNDKAIAFLLAGNIYDIGHRLYVDDPKHLVPIVFSYAEAATAHQEPIALELYKEALPLFKDAFGEKDQINIAPLISAADEAARRKEPELAFGWYKEAQTLLTRHLPNGSFLEARKQMGLAYLFRRADQLGTSEEWAHRSMALLEKFREDGSAFDIAGLFFEYGEVKRALSINIAALHGYEKALSLYLSLDQDDRWIARRIGTVYGRLTEINYKLSEYQAACQNVASRLKFHGGEGKIIAYDPLGQFSSGHGKQKTGAIAFRFSISEDCRASDLHIMKTDGITKEEAYSAMMNLFLTPGRLTPGKHVTAEGELTDIWPVFSRIEKAGTKPPG